MSGNSRKKLRAIFLASLMFFWLFAGTMAFAGGAAAQQQEADILVGSSDDADHSTVQAAIDNANDDDIISIESGTYDSADDSPVTFDSQLSDVTLKANDPTDQPELTGGIDVDATVDGLTLEDLILSGDGGASRTLNVGGGSLSDVTIDSIIFDGSESINTAIYGNSFSGDITIVDSRVSDYTGDDWELVYFGGSGLDSVEIVGSTVQDSTGMVAFGEISNSVTVEDNTFSGIEQGSEEADAALALGDPALGDSATASISGNTFSNNFNHVVLGEVDGETIQSVVDSNDFDRAAFDDQLISSSIQNVVDSANPDDTVSVGPGTYEESVTIDVQDLTLEGVEGADVTTIDADGAENTIFIDEVDDVTVDGFELVGASDTTLDIDDDGNPSANVEILNNVISDTHSNDVVGISQNNGDSDGLLVEGNEFDPDGFSNVQAIALRGGADDLTVRDNEFNDHRHGVLTTNPAEDADEGLEIVGNEFGNTVDDGDDDQLSGVIVNSRREVVGNIEISDNTFADEEGNEYVGVIVNANDNDIDGDSIAITNNNFEESMTDGVTVLEDFKNPENGNTEVIGAVDATENWWGDASGPSGEAEDPIIGEIADGNGATVSEDVRFAPWLDAPVPDGDLTVDEASAVTTGGTINSVTTDPQEFAVSSGGSTAAQAQITTDTGDRVTFVIPAAQLQDRGLTASDITVRGKVFQDGEEIDITEARVASNPRRVIITAEARDSDPAELRAVAQASGKDEPSGSLFQVAAIKPDARLGLAITDTNAPVPAGDPLAVDIRAVSIGDFAGSDDLTLAAAGATNTTTVTVASGGRTSTTLSVPTDDTAPGEVTITVNGTTSTAQTTATITSQEATSTGELLTTIDAWRNGERSTDELLTTIAAWRASR